MLYLNNEEFDAYFKIINILSKAKKELIIIDGYSDLITLDIISKLKCNVILITKSRSNLSNLDIDKYNKQYHNLSIIYDDSFHDRYFILDSEIIYHCGSSINHAGSKTFSINKLEDDMVKMSLINRINEIKVI